jgi:hypothetical protein
MQAGGTALLQIATTKAVPSSTITFQLTASSGTFTQTIPVSASIMANNFAVAAVQTALAVKQGGSGAVSLSTKHLGVFNSAVSLSLSGLPAGVTGSFSRSSVPAPGDGTFVVTFNAALSARTGSYTVTVTAAGAGQTQTASLTVIVAPK